MKQTKNLIVSISSDIGFELAKSFLSKNEKVIGTYRSSSKKIMFLKKKQVECFRCDISSNKSVDKISNLIISKYKLKNIIMAVGDQNPIGKFQKINFDNFEKSLKINFINQIRFLNNILKKKKNNKFNILLFAGGGTNNATENYMAYTLSKIALIKFCELLAFENRNVKISILGPGWVKTKIHSATLKQKKNSGKNFYKTKENFSKNNFYPIEKVVDCCNWLLKEKKQIVNGRNFSAVFDPWESKKIKNIKNNPNNFKLRRFGNDIF